MQSGFISGVCPPAYNLSPPRSLIIVGLFVMYSTYVGSLYSPFLDFNIIINRYDDLAGATY